MQHAQDLIENKYGDDFYQILSDYMSTGYVYISPTIFALAKRDNDDELFVYLAIGGLDNLVNKIDFIPKTLTCYRRGMFKTFDYQRLLTKLPKH